MVSHCHEAHHHKAHRPRLFSYLVLRKKLFPRHPRNLHQPQLIRPRRQRPKREIRRLVQLQKLAHNLLDQVDRVVGAHAVPPPQLARVPPPGGAVRRLVDEALAVPDGRDVVPALGDAVVCARGQVEVSGAVGEDVVDGDEDGRAELNGLRRVAVRVDGQGAAADAVRLFKDCDVDLDAGFLCILSEMIRS